MARTFSKAMIDTPETERRTGEDRRSEPRGPERRKGPGRPRLQQGEDPYRFHLLMPSDLYDRACVYAIHCDISVAALIRDALLERLDKPQA